MADNLDHLRRLLSTKPSAPREDEESDAAEGGLLLPKDGLARDYDPEDVDFGGTVDRTSASSRKRRAGQPDAVESRAHYRGIPAASKKGRKTALPIDDEDFMGGKYAGKKTTRAELGLEPSQEAERVSSEQHSEDDDRFSYSDGEDAPVRAVPSQVERTVEEEGDDLVELHMVARRVQDDKERGRHVKLQLEKWQNALDVRVRLQPLLTMSQRVPELREWRTLGDSSADITQLKRTVEEELSQLVGSLLEHVSSFGAMQRSKGRVSGDSLQEQERALRTFDVSCSAAWKGSLDQWHQKIALLLEGVSAKKQLKVINQSLWSQVENSLRDKERLVRRALTRRAAAPPFTGTGLESPALDDSDFFAALVRSWVDTGAGVGGDVAAAAGLVVKKVKETRRSGVDPRASKGRKLRYDVQDKIVNFMVPEKDSCAWPDDKIDTFFVSIFPEAEPVETSHT